MQLFNNHKSRAIVKNKKKVTDFDFIEPKVVQSIGTGTEPKDSNEIDNIDKRIERLLEISNLQYKSIEAANRLVENVLKLEINRNNLKGPPTSTNTMCKLLCKRIYISFFLFL